MYRVPLRAGVILYRMLMLSMIVSLTAAKLEQNQAVGGWHGIFPTLCETAIEPTSLRGHTMNENEKDTVTVTVKVVGRCEEDALRVILGGWPGADDILNSMRAAQARALPLASRRARIVISD